MRNILICMMLCMLPLSVGAHDHNMVPVRSIAVSGKAEVKVSPDKADVQVPLHSEARDLADAKRDNDKKLVALKSIVRDLDIDEKDVHTQSTNIRPRYRYPGKGKRVLDGYIVSHRIRVTLNKLDHVGLLIEKLLNADIDRVGQVQYGLQNDAPVKDRAMVQAVQNAKTKAGRIAQSLEVELGKVLSVNETGSHYQPPVMMGRAAKAEMMMMDAAATPEAPPVGDIVVHYNVQASFAIED